MDLKDIAKKGSTFKATLNKPGAPSLQRSINRLATQNSTFRNLKGAGAAIIAKVVKPGEKDIRLKGGLSLYRIKSGIKALGKAVQATKGSEHPFTKLGKSQGAKLIKMLGKSAGSENTGEKKVIPFRPYLDDTPAPKIGMGSVSEMNQHVSSINTVVNHDVASIKSVDTHHFGSINNLTSPDHSVSVTPPSSTIPRPTGLLGRMGGDHSGMPLSSDMKPKF